MVILHLDEQTGWRGGEQQASYLIRGLVERGHRCILSGRPQGAFLLADHGAKDIERIPLPFRGEVDLWTAWRLAAATRRYGVDIVHAHTSHTHTLACLARRFGGQGKVVVSRRVDFLPKATRINRWKYRCPDRIVAISQRIGDVVLKFGVPPDKLDVVHSCIDPVRFDVPPIERSELGVPEGAPLLGNVAALVGHKDHATLLAAMPFILRELPNLHLVIAGEGELRGALESQIGELGIEDAVHLLGYRKDVPRILRALDAFVLSSKLEGLGTSVLDAMACALPVVATAGGGIPEMVTHERTGLLCPVQNPRTLAAEVVRVFKDPVLARTLALSGKKLVEERFTVDRMIEGNLRVYENVLGRSAARTDLD